MAAITSLSTLALNTFRAGRGFVDESGSRSLVAHLNTIATKVNAVIARFNAGTLDQLTVDPSSYAGTYGAGQESWLIVDGTNPPTLASFRIIDRNGGAYVTATYDSSAGGWQFA